jgi:large subunit ribosomal protein L6
MSRLGNKAVALPSGVKFETAGRTIKLSGPKGNLDFALPPGISAKADAGEVVVTRDGDTAESKARHGLTRAMIANMVHGVHQGYKIQMEVHGTGYTCKLQGKSALLLNVGFMGRGVGKPAQFVVPIPAGLTVTVETEAARGENEPGKFTVTSIDKQLIGQFCAEVRKIRKPEPYKGKGIRYAGEHITRKVGKQFAGGG